MMNEMEQQTKEVIEDLRLYSQHMDLSCLSYKVQKAACREGIKPMQGSDDSFEQSVGYSGFSLTLLHGLLWLVP